jgi:hypothetical protein
MDLKKRHWDKGCRISALATRRAADFYQALGYTANAEYFSKQLVNP